MNDSIELTKRILDGFAGAAKFDPCLLWRIFANKGRSVSGSVLLGGAEERQFCSLGRLPTLLHLLSGSVLKKPISKRGVCTSCPFATLVKVGESW